MLARLCFSNKLSKFNRLNLYVKTNTKHCNCLEYLSISLYISTEYFCLFWFVCSSFGSQELYLILIRKHEYEKHGTCAAVNPYFATELNYFQRTLDFNEKFDVQR